jgi:hypothetical protein
MLFNCLSATVGFWLLATPALWPENPGRAVLAAIAGLVVIVTSVMGIAMPRARFVTAVVGATLAFSNFFLAGEMGALVDFAVSGLALIVGGLAPEPRVLAEIEVLKVRPSIPATDSPAVTTAAAA